MNAAIDGEAGVISDFEDNSATEKWQIQAKPD